MNEELNIVTEEESNEMEIDTCGNWSSIISRRKFRSYCLEFEVLANLKMENDKSVCGIGVKFHQLEWHV